MTKTLLIVSGGAEALPGIRLAKELGHHVVVSDGNGDAPGFDLADSRLVASVYDPEETVMAALRFHREVRSLDGVMTIAADAPVTVARVAEEIGLPGIPVEAARLATDKLAMKERFAADGVPVPWFAPVRSVEELRALVATHEQALVLKPVDSRGSRGVLRLGPDVDLGWAFGVARAASPTGRVMVERFLSGPQVSTESIVLDGRAYTPGFSDRNYERLERHVPYMIEDGGQLPSELPAGIQAAVRDAVASATRSLGICNGVVKGDIVVHEGRAHVIELAARLSGGYFCTHQIPLATGVSTVRAVIQLALGEQVDPESLQPGLERGVAQRYLFAPPGRVRAIRGVDRARALPGVAEIVVHARPGTVVREVTDTTARLGTVIASGETRREAVQRARAAIAAIEVEVEEAR